MSGDTEAPTQCLDILNKYTDKGQQLEVTWQSGMSGTTTQRGIVYWNPGNLINPPPPLLVLQGPRTQPYNIPVIDILRISDPGENDVVLWEKEP